MHFFAALMMQHVVHRCLHGFVGCMQISRYVRHVPKINLRPNVTRA